MRHILLFITFLICSFESISQCPEQSIYLYTQAEIDNFNTTYPGCTRINGDFRIQGEDITNLNGLSQITEVSGDFAVSNNPNLTSLVGLNSLKTVEKVFYIDFCPQLTDLTGLSSLNFVETLYLYKNQSLQNLTGMIALNANSVKHIQISINPSIESLDGLEKLEYLQLLSIDFNPSLKDISSLTNLTSVSSLYISGNVSLTSLKGLDSLKEVKRTLIIYEFKGQDLAGLDALEKVGENLSVNYNTIKDLAGLDNLKYVGGYFHLVGNSELEEITALNALTFIGGEVNIQNNPKIVSLSGFDNVTSTGMRQIIIVNCPLLSECSVKSVCSFLRNPTISGGVFDNAPGCSTNDEILESDACIAFPVKLIRFSGINSSEGNKLTWITASEITNKGFEIERSHDAKIFSKIGFVNGNGDADQEQQYTYTDTEQLPISYYRLKQLDFDGKSTNSKIIVITGGDQVAKVYPNPARGQLHIESANQNQPYSIRNVQGFSVMESSVLPNKPVDTSSLQNGIYVITVGKETFKVAVQN